MEARRISVLGSTGSIGTSTLEVIRKNPERFKVVGLSGGDNVSLLAEQVKEFGPKWVSTKTEQGKENLQSLIGKKSIQILFGTEGAEKVASAEEAETVITGIVGAAGLKPTLAAAKAGKTIGLANKETMVVAGALVSQVVKESKATILPVDSEHSAIFQSLAGSPMESVHKLILTASGGPFFKKPEIDLNKVTVDEALSHPNWKMGPKITVDSATMMNKGLEIIEARWLFGLPEKQIDVIVHPQSVIHSMVEFVDGSVLAQLAVPDMKGPISYALAYPDRLSRVMDFVDFAKLRTFEFFEPDHLRFPCVELARQAIQMGETFPAVLNGSN